MRAVYHEKLADLAEQPARPCGLAGTAMKTRPGVVASRPGFGGQGFSDHDQIKALGKRAEESAVTLLALQQPVAAELRSIVSWIQIVADIERMGALAVHVAKIVRQRHPDHVLPTEVEGYFAEKGRVAVESAQSARKCC